MGLPAIATNFSGPSAFMTAANSLPLPVARHLVDGSAEPAIADLRRAMRRCVEEAGTDAAQDRTRQARTDMVSKFSRSAVADIVVERVRALAARRQRQLAKKSADAVEL